MRTRRACALVQVATAVALSLAALLAPTAASAQANVTGQWTTLSYTTPINPIHVALMRTGKILIAVGSENDPTHTVYRAAVYDWRAGTFSVQTSPWDLFCNAISALPDGRLFITGGNQQYNTFNGLPTTTIFDPATERFIQVQDMAHGRWYPSNALLATGQVMTFSGMNEVGVINNAVEIYDVPTGWSPEFRAPFTPWWYPWLHLLPSGKVFLAGPRQDTYLFDPAAKAWSFVANSNYVPTSAQKGREYGSSVLLPLRPEEGYRPRVVIFGGDTGAQATNTVELIDLSAPSPAWRSLPPMAAARVDMNAVLLPNGKVLTLGGSGKHNVPDSNGEALNAQILDPITETWSAAGALKYWRMYHSVALLLPDATVWVAGSNPYQGSWENRMEVYAPPYLFSADGSRATRPTITGAPSVVDYNAPFAVQTPNAADIGSVVLIRPGSATHGANFDQRVVALSFTAASGVLNVTSPPNSSVAPPGYYMLFILNRAGVPSMATFVRISPNPANQPPRGSISNPATDVTITAGQSVTFAGDGVDVDGAIARYSWVFPGGSPRTSAVPTPGAVTFSTPGTYIVSLTVTDDRGANDPSPPSRTITVVPAGFTAAITSPTEGATVAGDQTVVMAVSGGGTPSYTYVLKVDGAQVFATTTADATTTFTWNTASVPNGAHTLTLTATDAGGRVATATRTVTVSQTGMTVAMTTPQPGEAVSGTYWVNVWVNGASGPFNYTLTVGGAAVWTEASANPHVTLPWDTTRTPDGPQTLTATVQTSLKASSSSVNVTVRNGTGGGGGGPLTASFTSPAAGATVSGNAVVVGMASSGAAPGIMTYRLSIDGAAVSVQQSTATTVSYTWDTTTGAYPNGSHALTLTVTDSTGATNSATRTVTVQNSTGGGGGGGGGTLALALTSPKPGDTVSGTSWVNIWIQAPYGTPPYAFTMSAAGSTVWTESSSNTHVTLPWVTTQTPNGAQTLTVSVRDAAGATGSTSVGVTVQNAGGGASPLVGAFTSPAAGATVSGTVSVAMSASGGTPAYTYALRIDGAQVYSTTTASTTAAYAWDTTGAAAGSHTLTLTLTDSAGASVTVTRSVTVQSAGGGGGGGTLSLALTSPTPGTTVSGTYWVNIWVQAPYGTAPYTFTMSAAGATVWTESSSSTHVSLPWVTTSTPSGPQTLTVSARDAAGATGSTSVNVTVQNAGGGASPLAAAFTSPADGATVSGTVAVSMSASGGTPAYAYTLKIDNAQAYSTTTTATSASFGWNTTTATAGGHTLALTVTDAAGASVTVTRSVTVQPSGGGALTLALTTPQPGTIVSGTYWVNIWVQAPYGTAPYTFTMSAAGARVWSESASSTHVTLPWGTTQTPNGPQTLTVNIRDAAGATGSAAVAVTVSNP